MVSKIKNWLISSGNRVYYLYKPVPQRLKKWNTNFHLERSVPKNRTTCSDVPLLPEIVGWNDSKVVSHLLSNWISWDFPPPGGGGGAGRALGISGWGFATGTLEPLTYTRASSARFCYPILEKTPQVPPYPRVAISLV